MVVPSEQVVDPSTEAGGATSGQATPLAPHTFETEVALKQIADQPSAPSVGSRGPRGFAPKKKIVPWSGKKHKAGASGLAPAKALKTGAASTAGAVAW